MMKKTPLFLFVFLFQLSLIAQDETISIGKTLSFSSHILKEDRTIAIYLPENYEQSKEQYPVLYLLDAEWHFHYVTGIIRQLSNSGNIPKMIVVGLVNNNRNRDLTPSGKNEPPNSRFGGAEHFLQFITAEVQPFLEKQYRLQPYRILAGHSFGGLFSIYSMMQQPDFFQAYIALSPSLGRNNEQQVQRASTSW